MVLSDDDEFDPDELDQVSSDSDSDESEAPGVLGRFMKRDRKRRGDLTQYEGFEEDDDGTIVRKMKTILALRETLGVDDDMSFIAEMERKETEKRRLAKMSVEERIKYEEDQAADKLEHIRERHKQRQLELEEKRAEEEIARKKQEEEARRAAEETARRKREEAELAARLVAEQAEMEAQMNIASSLAYNPKTDSPEAIAATLEEDRRRRKQIPDVDTAPTTYEEKPKTKKKRSKEHKDDRKEKKKKKRSKKHKEDESTTSAEKRAKKQEKKKRKEEKRKRKEEKKKRKEEKKKAKEGKKKEAEMNVDRSSDEAIKKTKPKEESARVVQSSGADEGENASDFTTTVVVYIVGKTPAMLRTEIETLVRLTMPQEIDNVDYMMEQFAGNEQELIDALRNTMRTQMGQDDEIQNIGKSSCECVSPDNGNKPRRDVSNPESSGDGEHPSRNKPSLQTSEHSDNAEKPRRETTNSIRSKDGEEGALKVSSRSSRHSDDGRKFRKEHANQVPSGESNVFEKDFSKLNMRSPQHSEDDETPCNPKSSSLRHADSKDDDEMIQKNLISKSSGYLDDDEVHKNIGADSLISMDSKDDGERTKRKKKKKSSSRSSNDLDDGERPTKVLPSSGPSMDSNDCHVSRKERPSVSRSSRHPDDDEKRRKKKSSSGRSSRHSDDGEKPRKEKSTLSRHSDNGEKPRKKSSSSTSRSSRHIEDSEKRTITSSSKVSVHSDYDEVRAKNKSKTCKSPSVPEQDERGMAKSNSKSSLCEDDGEKRRMKKPSSSVHPDAMVCSDVRTKMRRPARRCEAL